MSKKMIVNGFKGLVAAGLVGMLAACGGGGGGDSDSDEVSSLASESIVVSGVITQLGSIWVLGVEYETPKGRSYSNDDEVSDEAHYEVGQWVRIRGKRYDDGVSGIAEEVEYEAEIEGAADASGDINGVVIVRALNINAPGIPDPLNQGIRYEVSGIWLDNFTIEATYIKLDDDGDGEDEIKGFVTAVNPGLSLTVRGVIYSYGGPTVVTMGDFVEIHFNGTTANKVELEDDFNDDADGQEAEYEGAVNMTLANCPTGADFMIDMTCIDWSSVSASGWQDGLTGPADMESGLRVESEGHFNAAGLLIAEKIKGRGNRVRITANVNTDSKNGVTFKVFDNIIEVTTQDGLTEYEDPLVDFSSINDTSGSESGLEIRGIRTGPKSMLALRIKDEGGPISADKHELRAEVDVAGADSGAGTITVMGVTSMVDGGTELEIDDAPFIGSITSFLEMIEDDANGPRDIVEVDVDTTTGNGSLGTPYDADEIEIEEEDD
jgi:hypothetical protein